MRFLRIATLALTFLVVCSVSAYSQKSTFVGINATFETDDGPLRPSAGIVAEKRFTRHSGIESGLYYRRQVYTTHLLVQGPNGLLPVYFTVVQKFLSVPVLYKYYSRIVNVSVGPTFDLYVGWRQKNKSQNINVTSHNVHPDFSFGFMGKISKSFKLNSKIFLEPEVRYNPNFTYENEYVGFGVAAKYMIR
jgi:hypothetical protein